MITFPTEQTANTTTWQTEFLRLLPEIEQKLRQAFARRDPATVEDAVADGVYICATSFRRLHVRGKGVSITGANLAWFATKQLRSGRGEGCRLNSSDVLSRYAHLRRGFRVERLDEVRQPDQEWVHAITADWRSTVLDQVAARLDIAAWLATLCQRTRQIAKELAHGGSTSDVARKHAVTSGRISQLRRELADSWREFQHEPAHGT